MPTRTTSCLITSSSQRRRGSDSPSAKCRAPRVMPQTRPRLPFGAVCNTASAVWRRRSRFDWRNWGWSARRGFRAADTSCPTHHGDRGEPWRFWGEAKWLKADLGPPRGGRVEAADSAYERISCSPSVHPRRPPSPPSPASPGVPDPLRTRSMALHVLHGECRCCSGLSGSANSANAAGHRRDEARERERVGTRSAVSATGSPAPPACRKSSSRRRSRRTQTGARAPSQPSRSHAAARRAADS